MKFTTGLRILLVISLLICCSCGDRRENAADLTVSAAVSLKDAFDEIGRAFEIKTGRPVIFNYGASGTLQRQIENGAPVDVFASAGVRQMDELEEKKFLEPATRRDFARNTLVLIVPKDSLTGIGSFADLTKPQVQKIAVGNPKTVPAGQYAAESLKKMNLTDALQTKLIFAENVRQVLDYVRRGETDAGVVYQTDALTAKDGVKVVATADEQSHAPILYPLAIIKDSRQAEAAREFADFVMSAQGQAILQKYGFRSVLE